MGDKLWTSEFLSMSGANFLLFMSQYIMVAALPIFFMYSLGGGEVEVGLAMTFFQIGAISCRPFAGFLIDSMDKRHLMLGATGVFFLCMAGFSVFQSFSGIYGLRLVHGIVFAVATTAAATLAALVLPASRKGTGIGYFALSTNLAMAVGPFLGLVLMGKLGSTALFAFCIALGLLTFVLANGRRLPEEITKPATSHRRFSLSGFLAREALVPSLLSGLVFFAYGGVLTFLPLYAKGMGLASETSLFFAVFAGVIVLTRPLVGTVFDRRGASCTVYPGFLFFAVGMVIFGEISTLAGLLGSAVLLGIGFGALSPAFQTLAVRSVPAARSGAATATYFWALDISVGLAAVLLGLVARHFGYEVVYTFVSTAIIIAATIFYSLWRRRAA